MISARGAYLLLVPQVRDRALIRVRALISFFEKQPNVQKKLSHLLKKEQNKNFNRNKYTINRFSYREGVLIYFYTDSFDSVTCIKNAACSNDVFKKWRSLECMGGAYLQKHIQLGAHIYIMNWEPSEIVEQESDKFKRWIKESICIRSNTPTMNRDEGAYQLSPIWTQVISTPKPGGRGRLQSDFARLSQ